MTQVKIKSGLSLPQAIWRCCISMVTSSKRANGFSHSWTGRYDPVSACQVETSFDLPSLPPSFPPSIDPSLSHPPEPDIASSDATNMECTIQRVGNSYMVKGRKWWSSGAGDPRCKSVLSLPPSLPSYLPPSLPTSLPPFLPPSLPSSLPSYLPSTLIPFLFLSLSLFLS